MTADRPDAHELLEACSEHLAGLAAGSGSAGRYDVRLIQRALDVARAELALGEQNEEAETSSLRALLDAEGPVEVLRARLAAEIRSARWSLDDAALVEHLRADTARRLRLMRG